MHWSVSQEKYCGGFSSVDPPLSIPNREVKRTYADGTDRPVGRVGSRRSLNSLRTKVPRLFFFSKNGAYRLLFRGAAPKVPRRRRTPGVALLRTPAKYRRTAATALRYPIPRPLPSGKGSQSLRSECCKRRLPFSVTPTLDFHPQNRPFWCLPGRKPSSRHETAPPGVCPGKSSTGGGKNA